MLEVADELGQLRLEIVRGREPARQRLQVVPPSLALLIIPAPPADDAEKVLDGEDALVGKLVHALGRVALAEGPKVRKSMDYFLSQILHIRFQLLLQLQLLFCILGTVGHTFFLTCNP